MFTKFFVVKFVLIAIHRNAHQVKENVFKMVSGVIFFCPARSLGGNSDDIFITYSLELLPRRAARWKF